MDIGHGGCERERPRGLQVGARELGPGGLDEVRECSHMQGMYQKECVRLLIDPGESSSARMRAAYS